jgi:putative membrane protein
MMHHWDGGWGLGNWLVMGVGMLAFWVLVVAGIVWLFRYTSSNRAVPGWPGAPADRSATPARPSAQAILDERYARGEISDEEYRTRRDTLAAR